MKSREMALYSYTNDSNLEICFVVDLALKALLGLHSDPAEIFSPLPVGLVVSMGKTPDF
jgi:hypothetical protein